MQNDVSAITASREELRSLSQKVVKMNVLATLWVKVRSVSQNLVEMTINSIFTTKYSAATKCTTNCSSLLQKT